MNITILGAGSWAIALSVLLDRRGHALRLWEFDAAEALRLADTRESPSKLPGIRIPDAACITSDIAEAMSDAEIVVVAVPAQTARATARALGAKVAREVLDRVGGFVIVSKGIECGTLSLLTEILVQEIPGLENDRVVVLSGPSHAEEVSRNVPTTVVVACENNDLAVLVQEEFSAPTFRIYTNPDVIGVELCGSIKNVIAVAAGICDGLGFGDNTKGALLTRGMAEMVRLGRSLGAQESTFSGLAGFGDLITTCISRHSRNRNFGELIASGLSLSEALSKMTMVAEGVETARSAYALSQKQGVDMPITLAVYQTLFEGKPAAEAVREMMARPLRPENY